MKVLDGLYSDYEIWLIQSAKGDVLEYLAGLADTERTELWLRVCAKNYYALAAKAAGRIAIPRSASRANEETE